MQTQAWLAEHLRRLLEEIRFRGILSTEFKLDPRDARFKFIEINIRPWGDMGLALRCGVDVVEMAYRDALGMNVAPVTRCAIGRRWVGMYLDGAAAAQLIRAGRLGRLEFALLGGREFRFGFVVGPDVRDLGFQRAVEGPAREPRST